jgi:glucose-6-phosphate 1-dehydrogenase
VLRAVPPIETKDLVRGQVRDYRQEPGVSPNSQVETFAALRLHIDSWRWRGVPFYIRAGKYLAVKFWSACGSRRPCTPSTSWNQTTSGGGLVRT